MMYGPVICSSLEDWFEAYETFKPTEDEVDACMEALEAETPRKWIQGELENDLPLLKGGKWVEFRAPPSSRREPENDVFKPLKHIVDRLSSAEFDQQDSSLAGSGDGLVPRGPDRAQADPDGIRRHSTAQWTYSHGLRSVIPGVEGDGSPTRADGYFHRPLCEGTVSLADVSVLCQFERRTEGAVRNRRKLVSAASHLLKQDPCRFAVYGITIEDCDLSLWYFCRSHTAKSSSFNLLENPRLLVRVLISFLFADPSSLGFDANVRRIPRSPDGSLPTSYVYRLPIEETGDQHYYRTRRAIWSPHRYRISGRATRVWEAERVKSFDDLERVDDRVVALREVWLDKDARTERQTQQSIFASLNEFGETLKDPAYSPTHFSHFDGDMVEEIRGLFEEDLTPGPLGTGERRPRKAYETYFLTIREDFFGQPTRPVAKNSRADWTLFRMIHDQKGMSPNIPGTTCSDQDSATGHETRDWPPNSPPEDSNIDSRPPQPKRPYRLIYEEVCLDIDDQAVTSLQDIVLGLKGCFTALVLMFCAGWVHRDISCGNVLIWADHQGNKHGKLADLEYAKQFPSKSGVPDSKTGTAYFMPVEITLGYRLMSDAAQKKPGLAKPLTAEEKPQEREGLQGESVEDRDPLQHHFLHDLECLWWMSLWSVTCRLGNWDRLRTIFVPIINESVGVCRKDLLTDPRGSQFARLLEELPDSLRPLGLQLSIARRHIGDRLFDLAELDAMDRQNPATYSPTYSVLWELFTIDIPLEAPPPVKGPNPFWSIRSGSTDGFVETADSDVEDSDT